MSEGDINRDGDCDGSALIAIEVDSAADTLTVLCLALTARILTPTGLDESKE